MPGVTAVEERISFLANGVAEIRETHSADVILLGDRAYKVKKPVDLGFLDFRTEPARAEACRRELVLNRRLAPDVYLDVATISTSDGTVADHMVVMRRMPDQLRLSSLVEQGVDCSGHLAAVAQLMAGFHAKAQRGALIAAEAGAVGLARRWQDNLRETEAYRGREIPDLAFSRIAELAHAYIAGRGPLFAERGAAELYVDGHGDLIADDIFCLPDHPRVLDCIDFDDRLRWVDVLDDVAFLAMDLERLGRADLAEFFLAQYVEFSGVPTVVSLQHHYTAYRAFVRAKVACIRSDQIGTDAQELIDVYTDLAVRHLEAGEVILTVVGGAPGTGKTTIAGRLADQVHAVLLSSDVVRQQLPEEQRCNYDSLAKAAVYRTVLDEARAALERGESVVADATWTEPLMRERAEAVARETHSRFVAIECHAPIDVAAARAQRRLQSGQSLSQAGEHVARQLAAQRSGWPAAIPIDTSGTVDEAMRRLTIALATRVRGSAH